VSRPFRRVAVLAAIAAIAGLCAVGTPAAQAQTANPFANPKQFCVKHTPPPGARNSSNPGVTPNSIMFVDGGSDVKAVALLGITLPPMADFYKAFFDEINEKCGGINGRKLLQRRVPYLSRAVDQVGHVTANCLKATEEYKAFLITSSTNIQPFPRCAAVQHKSILMVGASGIYNSDDMRDSKGRIFSQYPPGDQVASSFLDYGFRRSLFKGKKVMVVGANREPSAAQDLTNQYLNPLKAKGVDAYLEVLPCISGINCRSQIGAVISRAKGNDVDLVVMSHLMPNGNIGTFWKNMQEQNLRAIVVGPVNLSLNADAVMPSNVNDAGPAGARFASDVGNTVYTTDDAFVVGAHRVGYKPTPFTEMCLEVLNRRLKGTNFPITYLRSGVQHPFWSSATDICKYTRAITRALWSLGNNVTTERMVTALSKENGEKTLNLPNFRNSVLYSLSERTPTKMATLRFWYPCPNQTPTTGCFMPAESPMRVRSIN
jgi:hypothetical protein